MPSLKDVILSQVPGHIIQDYPRFYDFLRAYYDWIGQEGNPYERIKNHMEYLDFEKSLDVYVDSMKQEYLTDIPESVLLDKELFIKWSKKFNLTRGSHASYKFLFRLLFNEQDTSIYLPKDNILRTSEGNWVSGESLMLVTNSGNQNAFQYQRIFQKRRVYQEIYDYAYAIVQRVRTKYAGRYNLTEIAVTNIEGEFLPGFPIETESGDQEWLIDTTSGVSIDDPGKNYQIGERIVLSNVNRYLINRVSEQEALFDTRVSSFFLPNDIEVSVNGENLVDFEFDGRYVSSSSISKGSNVSVSLPSYEGYMVIDDVDENGSVNEINILDLPIGTTESVDVTVDGIGRGFVGKTVPGLIKPVEGYYEDTKGHLSSNMYLQDSFFYQEYSYAIKTQQDFTTYSDIVKQILHPAGFAMFGQISILQIIELLINVIEEEDVVESSLNDVSIIPKYSLGPNYKDVDKFKAKAQRQLYKPYHFFDLDAMFFVGESGYNLEDQSLSKLVEYRDVYAAYKYFVEGYMVEDYYSEEKRGIAKGWMTKLNLADYHNYIPQEYSEERDSGSTYFETGYVSPRK